MYPVVDFPLLPDKLYQLKDNDLESSSFIIILISVWVTMRERPSLIRRDTGKKWGISGIYHVFVKIDPEKWLYQR